MNEKYQNYSNKFREPRKANKNQVEETFGNLIINLDQMIKDDKKKSIEYQEKQRRERENEN